MVLVVDACDAPVDAADGDAADVVQGSRGEGGGGAGAAQRAGHRAAVQVQLDLT